MLGVSTVRAILLRRKELLAELEEARKKRRRIVVRRARELWGVDLTLVWLWGVVPVWLLGVVDYYGSRLLLLEPVVPTAAAVSARVAALFTEVGAPTAFSSECSAGTPDSSSRRTTLAAFAETSRATTTAVGRIKRFGALGADAERGGAGRGRRRAAGRPLSVRRPASRAGEAGAVGGGTPPAAAPQGRRPRRRRGGLRGEEGALLDFRSAISDSSPARGTWTRGREPMARRSVGKTTGHPKSPSEKNLGRHANGLAWARAAQRPVLASRVSTEDA